MFVDDDGSFELTSYGVVAEDRLRAEVEARIAS